MDNAIAGRNDLGLTSPFKPRDGLQQASYDLSRASYLAGDDGRISPQFAKAASVLNRHNQVDRNRFSTMQRWQAGFLSEVHAQINQAFPTFERRKEIEEQVAEYLDRYVQERGDGRGLVELSEKMRLCRTSGVVGLLPDGRHVTAWDCKCGCPRLCPHESRVQTKRVIKQYVPAIQAWAEEHPLNEVHYAVLTTPNAPAGELHQAKRYIIERFQRQVLRATRKITDAERTSLGVDGRKKVIEVFPGIEGAFVCQEDPLAADGDTWNVHINVMLLVRGHLDYKLLRDQWGYNLHVRRLSTDADELASSILEVVKYSVEHVTPKSEEKAGQGKTKAPGLTDWSFDRFSEWWDAGRGFRRIRSYGRLYRLSDESAEQSLEDEPIEWIGTILRSEDGAYWVDLIQGNNFSQSSVDPTDLELLEDLEDSRAHFDPGG